MFKLFSILFRRGLAPLLVLGAGWYGGAKYGAPDLVIRAVDGVAARSEAFVAPLLGRTVEQGSEIAAEMVEEGSDYVVGTLEDFLEDLAELPVEDEDPSTNETTTASASSETDAHSSATPRLASTVGNIVLCKTRISNAPQADTNGIVSSADATVLRNGVRLLVMPATRSCLSSGYGMRNGRLHKGIDYYSRSGGDVLAAADGVIVERIVRRDYGNMIVVDHGNGVFTRYAHLARFGSGMSEGASVNAGQVLGPIGNSGSSHVVHLHYEILTGEYQDAVGSFGLDSQNPFSLPAGS